MAKFRKKPVDIEAIQFNGINADAIASSLGIKQLRGRRLMLYIETANGMVHARQGDWICSQMVCGKLDIWPCKADIFAATYDAVTD